MRAMRQTKTRAYLNVGFVAVDDGRCGLLVLALVLAARRRGVDRIDLVFDVPEAVFVKYAGG